MKIIQTLNDIEQLKAIKAIPTELIHVIEQDFINLYEAESTDEELLKFHLPIQRALILVEAEAGDDVLGLLDDPFMIEFVEKDKQDGIEYYRIAKRFENEFQLIFTLAGIHDERTEEWLLEQAEWNEGIGDFDV